MVRKIILTLFIIFGFFSQKALSQEIGIIAGPVAFQSDYGERHDFKTNVGNTGFGVGIVYYIDFSGMGYNSYSQYGYFNEHFKVRTELTYSQTKLQHFGKWVEKDYQLGVQKLKAMRGETNIFSAGAELEYYILDLHDFENTNGSFNPFISLGAQYSFYDPKAYSTLGELGIPETTIDKYIGATRNKAGGVMSVVGSVGTRYKLNDTSDLMLDMRVQYFFSDWVDGLKPDPNKYKENKANDWLFWFNVGYIYYLDF